jgi:hypothetical protein
MSDVTRKILVAYLLCVMVICVYVPWEAGPLSTSAKRVPAGYALIWSPTENNQTSPPVGKILGLPQSPQSVYESVMASKNPAPRYPITGVDYGRVVLELISLTAFFGIIYLASNQKTKPQNSEEL